MRGSKHSVVGYMKVYVVFEVDIDGENRNVVWLRMANSVGNAVVFMPAQEAVVGRLPGALILYEVA